MIVNIFCCNLITFVDIRSSDILDFDVTKTHNNDILSLLPQRTESISAQH